jgi:hypothetical protein
MILDKNGLGQYLEGRPLLQRDFRDFFETREHVFQLVEFGCSDLIQELKSIFS